MNGTKSIVLFRVTQLERNSPTLQKPARCNIDVWDLNQAMTNTLPRGTLYPLNRSLSMNASTNGWRYAVLSPGTYFFQLARDPYDPGEQPRGRSIVPRRGEVVAADWHKNTNQEACYAFDRHWNVPAYVLHVPPASPVVYAGSFQITNWSEKVPDWPPGFSVTRKHSSLSGPLDESEDAKRIVGESLPEFGGVHSSVASSFDYPSIPVRGDQLEVHAAGASGYATTGVGKKPAAWAAAPLAVPGLVLFEGSSDDGDLSGEFAGAVLMIAAGVVHAGIDATVGSAIRKNWAEHETALVEEYKRFGFEQRLAATLKARMAIAPATPASEKLQESRPTYSLQLEPYRTCLRETRRGKYALEVAVHVKLVEASSGNLIWENFLVSSDRQKAKKATWNFLRFPFETLIPSSSAARPLDQYTGEAGLKNFQDDLTKAVSSLTAEIASRLR